MNTKSISDIDRIKSRYGEEYAIRITKEEIGTGMIQNPKYNDGKPYFVSFRPPLHSPYKITNKELEEYTRLAEEIKKLEKKIKKFRREDREDIGTRVEMGKG